MVLSMRRVLAILLCLVSTLSFAQSIQLTAEQQRMLDQLPPAQREQALQVLRQQTSECKASAASPGEAVASVSPVVAAKPIAETQRAGANSRLVINFRPKDSLSTRELQDLRSDPTLSRIQGSRTFMLDDNGVLSLLGIESIPLLGLTESDIETQARRRAVAGQVQCRCTHPCNTAHWSGSA